MLPENLVLSYSDELKSRGLYEKAKIKNPGHLIHGGQSQEETDDHFAWRFANSSGRIVYSILSPSEDFSSIGNTILGSFTHGKVAVLDIPCGTGAMSSSLVSSLIYLRSRSLLPALPLTLSICAGDYSGPSLSIFNALMERLKPHAGKAGITLEWGCEQWDAGDSRQTAKLIDNWLLQAAQSSEYVVFVTHFSGHMGKEEAFDKYMPSVRDILTRIDDKQNFVLWLEPSSHIVRGSFLKRVHSFFLKHIPWRRPPLLGDDAVSLEGKYNLHQPMLGECLPSDVFIQYFDRSGD